MTKYFFYRLFFITTASLFFSAANAEDPLITTPANDNKKIVEPAEEEVKKDSSAPSNDDKTAEETNSDASPNANPQVETPKKIDLAAYIFNMDPTLNISLGLEVSNGDTHLIIEMDHNPTRNQFVFRFDAVVPNLRVDTVTLGNASFGFHNLPIAQLPMIEFESPNSSNVKFILGADNYRTHQRVNLSKVIKDLANHGLLIDSDGNDFSASDIKDFAITVKVPTSAESNINKMSKIKISTQGYTEDKIYQIQGAEPLAELGELTSYKVGDLVQIPLGYKIPYRSKETQWVLRVDLSTQESYAYELIKNPKVGDQFTIPANAENIDKVLPKLKEGYLWFKADQSELEITYVMITEGKKFNPNILFRYIKSIAMNLQQDHASGIDPRDSVLRSLSQMPISFRPERLNQITMEILATKDLSDIMQILMVEQYNFPVVNLEASVRAQCMSYLQ